jgi:hypothetical protein
MADAGAAVDGGQATAQDDSPAGETAAGTNCRRHETSRMPALAIAHGRSIEHARHAPIRMARCCRAHTTATFTQWIGGNASKRQLHSSPPSRPIQSWPVVVPK